MKNSPIKQSFRHRKHGLCYKLFPKHFIILIVSISSLLTFINQSSFAKTNSTANNNPIDSTKTDSVLAEKNLEEQKLITNSSLVDENKTPITSNVVSPSLDNRNKDTSAITTKNTTDKKKSKPRPDIESLMFNKEELKQIEVVIDLLQRNQIYSAENDITPKKVETETAAVIDDTPTKLEDAQAYVHLGSIIYLNDKQWAVWINDKKIIPEMNSPDKEIYVESVKKDRVKVVWAPSLSKWKILMGTRSENLSPEVTVNNNVEMKFELKPNQSFVLTDGSIIEGKTQRVIPITKTVPASTQIINPNNTIPGTTTNQNNTSNTNSDNSNDIKNSLDIEAIKNSLKNIAPAP